MANPKVKLKRKLQKRSPGRPRKTSRFHDLKCQECNKVFKRPFSLERHNLTVHQPTSEEYICEGCGKSFVRKDHQVSHQKACQNGKHKDKCPICDVVGTKSSLTQHYKTVHGIEIEKQVIQFSNIEEFSNWKNQYEKENVAKYIKLTEYTRSDLSRIYLYACHRNGFCKGEGPRVRRSKIQGTNKISGWCPSQMKVASFIDGSISASFISTHVGHGKDIERIPLTKEEKDELAQRLSAKVPVVRILNDVQYSVANSGQLKRIHLLSRKDLNNIKITYKIKENKINKLTTDCHEDNAVIDHEWIRSAIRFNKEKGCTSEVYPEISSDDFLLVIMSDGQRELFEKFGERCVSIINVHSRSSFNLVTLLILNDHGQTLPCAFLYSNSINPVNLSVFFNEVKNITHCIKTNIFLSDLNDMYYQVWCHVMLMPKSRFYCSLHVWRAWRRRLAMTCFNNDYKQIINNNLRVILEETDAGKFQKNLTQFIADLYNNELTENFAVFFESLFSKSRQLWAYCFRNEDAIRVDTQLDRVHSSLEYICSQGKGDNHIQRFSIAVVRFLHFTIAEWMGITDKKYKDLKILDIRKKHREALEMEMQIQSSNDLWYIISNKRRYIIKTANTQCECDIRCEECTACIHAFYCSCVDSKLKWNMCKHIHHFCRKILIDVTENENTDDIAAEDHIDDICFSTTHQNVNGEYEIAKLDSSKDDNVHDCESDIDGLNDCNLENNADEYRNKTFNVDEIGNMANNQSNGFDNEFENIDEESNSTHNSFEFPNCKQKSYENSQVIEFTEETQDDSLYKNTYVQNCSDHTKHKKYFKQEYCPKTKYCKARSDIIYGEPQERSIKQQKAKELESKKSALKLYFDQLLQNVKNENELDFIKETVLKALEKSENYS